MRSLHTATRERPCSNKDPPQPKINTYNKYIFKNEANLDVPRCPRHNIKCKKKPKKHDVYNVIWFLFFFKKKLFILCIFGWRGLRCCEWILVVTSRATLELQRAASQRGASVATRALQHRLHSCGTGFSCSRAYGIFPDQGSNLHPLHWQADS